MLSICSVHYDYQEGCLACASTAEDLIPGFRELLAGAEVAGIVVCKCGFKYYATVDDCPMCGKRLEECGPVR